MAIEGKVADILNERELVINRGLNNGVKIGMRFKVMEPERSFVDPVTEEHLGTLSREKIPVKIVDIRDKFAIGRTYETHQAFGAMAALGALFGMSTGSEGLTRVKTL